MGSRLVKYEFSPKENEQIEAVLKVPYETRSVIHGVVIDCKNRPIKDAVVKLLEVMPGNPCRMKPLTHTFTDGCGQFLFGPLYCDKKYALKVWYSDVKIRELIISPNCDDEYNDSCSDDRHSDEHNDDCRDCNYEGHYDISFDDYVGSNNADKNNEFLSDEYSVDYNYHIESNSQDSNSDDDKHMIYKGPKLYVQKCSKCQASKINTFENIEK